MKKAEAVLGEMKTAGVNANVVTYTTLVKGWVELKDMEKAEAVLGDMKTAGVNADAVTYTTLIRGYADQDDKGNSDGIVYKMVYASLNTDGHIRNIYSNKGWVFPVPRQFEIPKNHRAGRRFSAP